MRPLLFAVLLAACSPSPPRTAALAVPAEVVAPSPSLAGTYRFVVSTRHEISCSQSFETHGVSVTYDLRIEPSSKVTLKVDGHKSSTFGPAYGADASGLADAFDHRSTPFAEQWSGIGKQVGDTVQLDLESGGLHWKLACTRKTVEARPPSRAGTDPKATAPVVALSCSPPRRLAEGDVKSVPALLFAGLPGLRLTVDDDGGGELVELRHL